VPARLLRGRDPGKDQSYFLHAVPGPALGAALFPLGDLHKAQVREMANDAGLPVHAKRDSTGICFIGERPFREFLARYLRGQGGPMQTPDGRIVGQHEGLMHYTPGQRKGLGIGGQSDGPDDAWYVARKDTDRNRLIVVQGRDHPLLWSDALIAGSPSWINTPPAGLVGGQAITLTAKIRYRQPDAPCQLRRLDKGRIEVQFDEPQWAVAPGQSVVFYAGDECLGGAVIEQAGRPASDTAPLAVSA
jgi:tRNA-specific 2-thiouridylase